MKHFPTASLDTRTKIFTFLFGLFSIGLFFMMFFLMKEEDGLPPYIAAAVGLLLITIFVVTYRMTPEIYVVKDTVYIKNLFVTIRIPINNIEGIKREERLQFNLRTFGVGGIFGYFGYFNGGDVWYVTNIHKKVKIKMNSKLYIISPENPDEFIRMVKEIKLKGQ